MKAWPIDPYILVAHELGHAVLHTKIAMMHGFQEMEVFDDRSIEENEIGRASCRERV